MFGLRKCHIRRRKEKEKKQSRQAHKGSHSLLFFPFSSMFLFLFLLPSSFLPFLQIWGQLRHTVRDYNCSRVLRANTPPFLGLHACTEKDLFVSYGRWRRSWNVMWLDPDGRHRGHLLMLGESVIRNSIGGSGVIRKRLSRETGWRLRHGFVGIARQIAPFFLKLFNRFY